MAEQIYNSRVINKHDTEANWSVVTDFIPKQGEIIIYDIDNAYNYERFKIGDGKTEVNSLPFAVIPKEELYIKSEINTLLSKKADATTETWTFTLEDGSTVTKQVVVR